MKRKRPFQPPHNWPTLSRTWFQPFSSGMPSMRCGRAGLSCRLTALSRRLPLTYTASFVVRREFQIETGHVGFQQQVDQRPGAEQPETQVNGAVFLLALEVHRFEVPESLFVAVHGAPISSGEVVAGHDLVHASAGIGAAQQGVYDRAVPVERRRNMARAAVEPCAQIVQHFMDQRTALLPSTKGSIAESSSSPRPASLRSSTLPSGLLSRSLRSTCPVLMFSS